MINTHLRIIINNGIVSKIESIENDSIIIIDNKEYSLENMNIYPGFKDCHGHIFGLGVSLNSAKLEQSQNAEECVHILNQKPLLRSDWITGRGWNQENWEKREFPDKAILDFYFPDNPVYLTRIDGHAAWVNTKAMDLCSINKFTGDPLGGKILKDKSGNLTGILLDNAMDLILSHIPKYTDNQIESYIKIALTELSSKGLTEVHDMDVSPEFIKIYKKLDDKNELPLRIYSYIKAQNNEWIKEGVKKYNGNNFSVIGLKFYADGALGSRGAALLKPYSDDPENSGLSLITSEDLYIKSKFGIENGFDIAVHAIGDSANRMVLNVFKQLRTNRIADKSIILRIEHAQIVDESDIKLFSENNIIASVQPIHYISDKEMAVKRLGKRITNAYRWKSLIDSGVTILAGSDFPIESHDPLLGLDAFINSRLKDNKHINSFSESVNIHEAIDAYTVNAQKVINRSENKLKSDLKDDFTVIDTNLYSVDINKIKESKVKVVIHDGKIEYIS